MNIIYSEFKRLFSMPMYKNLKIMMGEMTFEKDFLSEDRGDIYPLMAKSDDLSERVEHNRYIVEQGEAKRLFCRFFPYATYEINVHVKQGAAGLTFSLPEAEATIYAENQKLVFTCGETRMEEALPDTVGAEFAMVISCRPGAFDVYFRCNDNPEYVCTFKEEAFQDSNRYQSFSNGYALLYASGNVVCEKAMAYVDNGISFADPKPITYENGDIMTENGKVYLTASVRIQEEGFQGIYSWVPGTSEIKLTGALFFDCGDDHWRHYLASSILYHREKKVWYIWVSSFEHEHILAHGIMEGDPRFGVNVADVTFMDEKTETSEISDFVGFKGDEDPDFYYDAEQKKWIMAICRLQPETKQYTYMFFSSDHPFDGYTYMGMGPLGSETGGSFVQIEGERFFVCGNDFYTRSEYRIYSKDGVKTACFNHPDNGFRGWGCVFPVKLGSRTRYFWFTFDRMRGSSYNWSYGNLYCFELGIDTKNDDSAKA